MKINHKQYRIVLLTCCLYCFFSLRIFAQMDQEPGEKILGFTLNNFDDKNNKTWDLSGATLETFGDVIQLTEVNANVYGEEDTMNLIADTGTYNRTEGKVHLEDNVVMTSESGAKMMTDTLDWFQKQQLVTTEDKVNITRGNLEAEGTGATAKPDLKQMSLKKEVQVDILPEEKNETVNKITIVCDGPLDIDYQKGEAVFQNNVEAFDGDRQLFADKMTGFFDQESKQIERVVCEGNVKIIRGKDTAYSERAIYSAKDQQVSLVGRPKLIIYSQKEKTEEKTEEKAE